jgi:hypothetical protein
MQVKPHVTLHNDGSRSAKLNIVETGGREVGNLYELANLLVDFAEEERVPVSCYALWITSRTDKSHLAVAEARKLLKAAEKADRSIEIEEPVGFKKDGTTYASRYVGRIKVGSTPTRSNTRSAKPLSKAAQAFLKA